MGEADDLDGVAARYGLSRAPGESDETLAWRMRWTLTVLPFRLFTEDELCARALVASWWVREVKVASDPGEGRVRVFVLSWAGLPVPWWVRRRVARELSADAPVNVQLVVL